MLTRRRELILGAAAAALLGDVGVAAAAQDPLTELKAARKGTKTLVGPFEQERKIGLLATVVKSTGEMTLVLPDRLRWELKTPDAIVYYVGPEGFSMSSPKGTVNASKSAAGRLGDVLGDILTLLGGDLDALKKRYDLSARREDGITLTAVPKDETLKKLVKKIEASTGEKLWSVSKIVIEEAPTKSSPSGDKSTIKFGKVERDAKVDPAKMKPPK